MPPLSYPAPAPFYWSDDLAADPDSELTADQCVIGGEHFFVRGLVRIPVVDTGQTFAWEVWVSLSATNFGRVRAQWHGPGREHHEPYFGWLATELWLYSPSTLNLKTTLHSRRVGLPPLIEVEATDHPLAVDQREGVTSARLQEFADRLLP